MVDAGDLPLPNPGAPPAHASSPANPNTKEEGEISAGENAVGFFLYHHHHHHLAVSTVIVNLMSRSQCGITNFLVWVCARCCLC